ncbi:hypothetical protein [Pseudomonas nunensis]|uniref:DUF4352 domain-containing protein n=1 Tax=Pseudomonas nunensis TaxID=2961896 RepID=A0ABY5EI64_9PSED|nr:hypothetical protein [Pseudomonas nunensis]KPN88389.1 hypothetical protein AL066_29635 [Pseudomonas nunensis]MCL5225962.1 hypothetical protein [Pseudomonas nunensis]UTO13945.1 hypothetical protein NK667_27890 [Pseudomonas nunensis]
MTFTPSRHIILASSLLLSSLCFAEGEPANDSSIKDSAKAAVSSAISAGKNLLGGVSEGVLDGRQSAQGVDGASIISSREQMKDRIDVQVLKTEAVGDTFNVTLGFKNSSDSQLRLINLKQAGALLAIDQDGYANGLTASLENPDDVTVPPKAAVRQKFVFEGPIETSTTVRVWGQDYQVKK